MAEDLRGITEANVIIFTPITGDEDFQELKAILNVTDAVISNNTTGEKLEFIYSIPVVIIICIVAGAASLVTVLGNLLVVVSFCIERRLRKPASYFFLSLAVADIFVGMTSMPLYTIYELFGKWPKQFGPELCDAWLALDYTFCPVSLSTIVVIAADRYLSLQIPLQYRTQRTKSKAFVTIGAIWCINVAIWFPSVLVYQYIGGVRQIPEDDCYAAYTTQPLFTLLTCALTIWLPLVITVILYLLIYRLVRRSIQRTSIVNAMLKSSIALPGVRHSVHYVPEKQGSSVPKRETVTMTTDRMQPTTEDQAEEEIILPVPSQSFNKPLDDVAFIDKSIQEDETDDEVTFYGYGVVDDETQVLTNQRKESLDSIATTDDGNNMQESLCSKISHISDLIHVTVVDDEPKAADMQNISAGKRNQNYWAVKMPNRCGSSVVLTNACKNCATKNKADDLGLSRMRTASSNLLKPYNRRESDLSYDDRNCSEVISTPRTSKLRKFVKKVRMENSSDDEPSDEQKSLVQNSSKAPKRFTQTSVRRQSSDYKAVKTLSFVIVAFVICWVPWSTFVVAIAYFPSSIPARLYAFSYWLCYVNSMLNPLCYAAGNPLFRQTFKRILCMGKCQCCYLYKQDSTLTTFVRSVRPPTIRDKLQSQRLKTLSVRQPNKSFTRESAGYTTCNSFQPPSQPLYGLEHNF